LRKLWILVFAAAIVGGSVFIEYYVSLKYPVTNYAPKGLPPLPVGVKHDYDFFKEGEKVGRYVFWVEGVGEHEGQTTYFTRSLTSVVYEDTVIELETVYLFNSNLNPLEYRLNATLGEDHQSIVCLFDGWNVNASVEMEDNTLDRDVELPLDTVLIDTNMLGHWDLLFKSFDLVAGKRVRFTMFVPQALDMTPIELVVDKGTETLTLSGVTYECQVVRATTLNLTFYLHNGDLLELEESTQNIEIISSRS